MSNRFAKSLSDSQFDVGAGRFQPAISANRVGTSHRKLNAVR